MNKFIQDLIAQEKIPPLVEDKFVPFSRFILHNKDLEYLSSAEAVKVIMSHLQLPWSKVEQGMVFADNCGPAALFHVLQMTKAIGRGFKYEDFRKLLISKFNYDPTEGMDGGITPKVLAEYGLKAEEHEVGSVQEIYELCSAIKGVALCAVMEGYTVEEYQQDPSLEEPGGHYCVFAGVHNNGAIIINSSTETGKARKLGDSTFTVQLFGKNYHGESKNHPLMKILTDFAVEHPEQISKEGVKPPSVWYPNRVWIILS